MWAPTLREQGFDLILDPHDVTHFMQDDAAISRLHVRGIISISTRALREWLGGSKVAHLFEGRRAALESSRALFQEALALAGRARDGASQKESTGGQK